ncbi:MAG: hypothetical protein A2103_04610 [Gammaproteobacteria bacterium GWF2_41_13]|nr:MAG: hypothetical protein A2103_04610 [Gammaproteobacteria bacterium GWF2_41_13]
MPCLTVYTDAPNYCDAAKQLAQQLNLPFLSKGTYPADDLLCLNESGLFITIQRQQIAKPFRVDFSETTLLQRAKKATPYNELIAKAIGKNNKSVLDATAGFGYDAFLLASLGYSITLVEQSLIVSALLADGLNRAKQNKTLEPIIQRMRLITNNSIDYLNTLTSKPDVIYLDPMFPVSKKTAKSKKEMQILQSLIGGSQESHLHLLLKSARQCAKNRVVVKRPRISKPLCDITPSFSFNGKAIRFDVYLHHSDKMQNTSMKQASRRGITPSHPQFSIPNPQSS